jgi:hypothetical protein
MQYQLPVTSPVGPTATVEASTSTAMEPAATMKRATAAEATSLETCTTVKTSAAVEALVPVELTTTMPSAFATESVTVTMPAATIVPTPSAVEAATTVEAMEPRTCANKHATGKIVRAVVSVRRACVGGISIVAIRADWSRANVGRAKLNCNLRMGCPCNNHEKPEQNNVL